jgi:hypothetical protein
MYGLYIVEEFYYSCVIVRNEVTILRPNLFSGNLKKEINGVPKREPGKPVTRHLLSPYN